ncbi:MAG: sulfatase-like hydrolase/transferase, partial [Haloferula sp.]
MKALLYSLTIGLLIAGISQADPSKPNFIFIMADDLGYGDISSFGSQTIETPHIDSIGKLGARLTDFHSNGTVCSPTRAALMTGRYQQRSGVTGVVTAKGHRDKGLLLDETTFAEVLSEAGYATAMFGKWHLGYEAAFNPTHQGFDEFKGFVSGNIDYHHHIDQAGFKDWWQQAELKDEPGYLTDLITEHSLDFVERHSEKPFCLVLNHGAPHYPLQGRSTPGFRTKGNTKVNVPVDKPKAIYKEMIEVMDEGVGKLIDQLKSAKILDNTMIIFCSDNGPARTGDAGPLRGLKGQVWEGGHRVPAVVMWPARIPSGQTLDQTMMTMDMFATFLAAAGIKDVADLELDGIDLLPALSEGKALPQRTLFWAFKDDWAVRSGPWKVVSTQKKTQLFNLDEDLGEKTDLSEKFDQRKQEMIKAYERWKKETKSATPVS